MLERGSGVIGALFAKDSHPMFKNKWSLPFTYFDLFRGLAALMVLLHHCQHFLFITHKHEELSTLNPWLASFYFLSLFGRESVMVFFVLSGFFISSSVLRSWENEQWSWRDYLLKRMSRLYIVLIPALLLTIFWDQLGIALFSATGIYQGTNEQVHQSVGFHPQQTLGLQFLVGNLLFLQGINFPSLGLTPFPVFGSNEPLWSLSYEFWYYLLFPIGLCIVSSKISYRKKFIFAILGAGIVLFIGRYITYYFLVWLLGAAISLARPLNFINTEKRVNGFILLTFTLFASFLLYSHRLPPDPRFPHEFILGALFAGFMYALLHKKENKKNTLQERLSKKLASFSYTLYLVHYPPLIFFEAWLYSTGHWLPGYDQFSLLAIAFLGLLGYAYFISRITEAKTMALYQRLHQWMIKVQPAPP
jgi:peptidoglycan/LPS O-acetylase OafA/YrhL